MRFDDGLATVLQQPVGDAPARETAWRQIVDLLAQRRIDGDVRLERDAYRRLRLWRPDIPADVRAAVAASLLGRTIAARLVAFFAEDALPVARPLLARGQVVPAGWLAILAELTPTARAILRHRTDLPPEVERALESFGQSDLVLAAPAAAGERSDEPSAIAAPAALSAPDGVTDAPDHAGHDDDDDDDGAPRGPAPALAGFAFESGSDGIVVWVDGAPREAVVGIDLGSASRGAALGVDGHAAGAVRARARFADARLTIGGDGPAGGAWRISAVPVFDKASGRYLGHRGVARRPRPDERAEPGLFGAADADGIRQLVHELRTPLNAISGFAEMIEHAVLGPVDSGMRARAGSIVEEARRLAEAIDDLDSAARPRTEAAAVADPTALIGRLARPLSDAAASRGVVLDLAPPALMPPVAGDETMLERGMVRLATALIAVAAPGERIAMTLTATGLGVDLRIDRPAALRGLSDRVLLNPAYSPEGDAPAAPVLGLGFTLRLVRSLISGSGGDLLIGADQLTLRMTRPDRDAVLGTTG